MHRKISKSVDRSKSRGVDVRVDRGVHCDELLRKREGGKREGGAREAGLHMMRHLALRCHLVLMHLAADV